MIISLSYINIQTLIKIMAILVAVVPFDVTKPHYMVSILNNYSHKLIIISVPDVHVDVTKMSHVFTDLTIIVIFHIC